MRRDLLQGTLAVLVWILVLAYAGVLTAMAIVIPVDVALVGLAVLRWRFLRI